MLAMGVTQNVSVGVMVEVPSAALNAHWLAKEVDFFSVGTNDLTQFLFAADRANPKLAERYDWLSPAILRFLSRIAKQMVGRPVRIGVFDRRDSEGFGHPDRRAHQSLGPRTA